MPPVHEPIIGLPDFKIISYRGHKTVEIEVEYIGKRGSVRIVFAQDFARKTVF